MPLTDTVIPSHHPADDVAETEYTTLQYYAAACLGRLSATPAASHSPTALLIPTGWTEMTVHL